MPEFGSFSLLLALALSGYTLLAGGVALRQLATGARGRARIDADTPVPVHRTAFVLAGGGSRGAVQVGMLAELTDRGIRADRVFGASVGAINGAAYAGNPTREGIERMALIWRDVKGTDVFPKSALDGPWAFFQKRASVHSNSGLRAIIEAGIDYENLEDTTIPFEVVTTSLTDGRERWFGHGNAVEAILASSAIPSILPPCSRLPKPRPRQECPRACGDEPVRVIGPVFAAACSPRMRG